MSAATPEREAIERRFVATVIGDSDGDYLRENLHLKPEAFDCFACREGWRRLVMSGSVEAAARDKSLAPFLTGGDFVAYWTDRIAIWARWLQDRGPDFANTWRDAFTTGRFKFPNIETEPEESDVLREVEPIIEGILEAGDKMSISSGSKSFKTWTLIQLCNAISSGMEWLGFQTHKRRVLFLNFELKPNNFWKRVYRVRRAMGLEKTAEFTAWNLRGCGFSMDTHADELIRRAKAAGAQVIILDPIYKLFGDRNESSAGDMATLMALFDKVATATGAAIIYAHHFAKGNSAAREAIDLGSGSGVFARDPDCLIALRRLSETEGDNTFSCEVTLREFAPVEKFGVRREHPLMIRDGRVNTANLQVTGTGARKYSADQLVGLLPPQGLRVSKWREEAQTRLGMAHSTFHEYLPAAKKLAEQRGESWTKKAA
jgi:hypothetical protein